MKQHFQKLFTYDNWANQRVIAAVQQLAMPDERCLHLLSHIFAAQEIWHDRITGKPSQIMPWVGGNLQECIETFDKTSKGWNDYLNSATSGEMNRIITYKNTKGDQFTNTVTDILTHVINHSTYHRAQIVSVLKGKIEKLPVTDFIAFARE